MTTEIENTQAPATPAAEPPAADDDDYFLLKEPITVGDKTFDRLLINPKKLGGKGFFGVVNAFQKRFPDIYRTSFNLYNEVHFLGLVIARLNRIAPEDLYKLDYTELPLLMLRASAFHYSGGATPKEEELPVEDSSPA